MKIDPNVLDISGVIISNSNAAGDYVRFAPSPKGLELISDDQVFAESWIHLNEIDTWKHKGIKCAEVLVPDQVEPRFIENIYVADAKSQDKLSDQLKMVGLAKRVMRISKIV